MSKGRAKKDETPLDARIHEVCNHRGFREAEWIRRAELSHGVLSTYRMRHRSDPAAVLDPETYRRLAEAAGIREEWLRTGMGPRDLGAEPVPYDQQRQQPAFSGVREAVSRAAAVPSQETITLVLERGRVPELRFGALMGWGAWLAEARLLRPDYGDDVWGAVAEMRLFLPGAPNPAVVACAADIVAGLGGPRS